MNGLAIQNRVHTCPGCKCRGVSGRGGEIFGTAFEITGVINKVPKPAGFGIFMSMNEVLMKNKAEPLLIFSRGLIVTNR